MISLTSTFATAELAFLFPGGDRVDVEIYRRTQLTVEDLKR